MSNRTGIKGLATDPSADTPAPIAGLLDAVRQQASERMWGAGVELARSGAVAGVSAAEDELALKVKTGARALPYEVFLWPGELDWGCDCGRDEVCVHVVAAAIAASRVGAGSEPAMPVPSRTFQVQVRYAFRAAGEALSLTRELLYRDGTARPLVGPLAAEDVMTTRVDAQAESLLARHTGRDLSSDDLRRLLHILEGAPPATLDGAPIRLSAEPVEFRIKVQDEGEGFKVGLFRPLGIDRLFRGAALVGDVLHPTSHGRLQPDQRRMLVRGVVYGAEDAGTLVSEVLPRLREAAPVDVESARLPSVEQLQAHVALRLGERNHGLEVQAELVYGDPPVARITSSGGLEMLRENLITARDRAAERAALHTFQVHTGLAAPFKRVLPPSEAVVFLRDVLPRHQGPVFGKVDPGRFQVTGEVLTPRVELRVVDPGSSHPGWELDVTFGNEVGKADPTAVLDAWRSGSGLVPLMDGGWAPLPENWLEAHGAQLRELLEARDAHGRVARNATSALVELLEDTESIVPPDLQRLQRFLQGDEELTKADPPRGMEVELRPYQVAGFQWLRFLRDMDLHGILADDMGLGKTIQAITAMVDAGGRHLVVAPTSVLRNWASEIRRFAPELRVNLYHGARRALDDSDVTLTSYALLRLDTERLASVDWSYLVLDESQSIKNPTSQTARAACKVPSRYRLALTGTPVENRLEELWSQFRFLMPGLLGGLDAFRDRFVRPIEAGDRKAERALRARVRPYVLRRLKQQVAAELPPLTEIVERCDLSDEQRKVYDTMRLLGRAEVHKVLGSDGAGRNSFAVLEALLRMRQACCDPQLLPGDVGEGVGSAKLDRMEELLVELVCEEHKALVFSQWTSLLDRAERRLDALGIAHVRLDGSTRDRQAVIDRFQSPEGPPVFLLSLKAGGMGLNLTAADYVLHLDPWWNPAVERQATDRAHRIGQDRPVVSIRLIAAGTVEERILDLQQAKRELAEAALGAESGLLRALSASEIRSLFDE